jgi:hypothetical protein
VATEMALLGGGQQPSGGGTGRPGRPEAALPLAVATLPSPAAHRPRSAVTSWMVGSSLSLLYLSGLGMEPYRFLCAPSPFDFGHECVRNAAVLQLVVNLAACVVGYTLQVGYSAAR